MLWSSMHLITDNLNRKRNVLVCTRASRLFSDSQVEPSATFLRARHCSTWGFPIPFPRNWEGLCFHACHDSLSFDGIYHWRTTPVRYYTGFVCPLISRLSKEMIVFRQRHDISQAMTTFPALTNIKTVPYSRLPTSGLLLQRSASMRSLIHGLSNLPVAP